MSILLLTLLSWLHCHPEMFRVSLLPVAKVVVSFVQKVVDVIFVSEQLVLRTDLDPEVPDEVAVGEAVSAGGWSRGIECPRHVVPIRVEQAVPVGRLRAWGRKGVPGRGGFAVELELEIVDRERGPAGEQHAAEQAHDGRRAVSGLRPDCFLMSLRLNTMCPSEYRAGHFL